MLAEVAQPAVCTQPDEDLRTWCELVCSGEDGFSYRACCRHEALVGCSLADNVLGGVLFEGDDGRL